MSQELKLYVRTEGSATWIKLDLRGGEVVNLSKKMLDVSRIDVIEMDSSKTIKLPFETNTHFFKRWGEQGYRQFDATAFYEAKLEKNSTILIQGSFYLIGLDRKTNNYLCMISSKVGSITARCGEKTLGDLSPILSSVYAHVKTDENVRDSFIPTTANDWRDYVKYAPVDNAYGIGLYTDVRPIYPAGTDNQLWDIRNSNTPYPIKMFKPAINMGRFLHLCFVELGLTAYVAGTNELSGQDSSNLDPWLILNDDIKTVQPPTYATTQYTPREYTYTELSGGKMSDTLPLSPVLISPVNGNITASFNTQMEVYSSTEFPFTGGLKIYADVIRTDSSGTRIETLGTVNMGEYANGTHSLIISVVAACNFTTSTYISIDIYTNQRELGEYSVLQLSDVTYRVVPGIKSSLSTIKMYDFIKYTILQYNLIPLTTTNGLKLYSYDMLIREGANVDWTTKIEYNEDFVINSLAEFLPKSLNYEYVKSDGYLDNQVINDKGKPYGSLGITINRSSLVDKAELKLPYAPFLRTKIQGEYPMCHIFKDINKASQTEIKPMCVFFNGRLDVTGWILKDDDSSLTTTYWPDWDMSTSTNSLAFRQLTIPGNRTATNDLFEYCHATKFNEWYGLNYTTASGAVLNNSLLITRRLIQCDVWLTYTEFAALTLGERVTITNSYGTFTCRILEVTGYDATKDIVKCKAKLITIA